MRPKRDLDDIRVASPCPAHWNDMQGDDKVRFCPQCRLNVYNLSAMDVEEAARLISEKNGRLCVRFYRRRDGTIITRDCPVGVKGTRQRLVRMYAGTVALCASFVGIILGSTARTMGDITTAHPLLVNDVEFPEDAWDRPEENLSPLMRAAEAGDVAKVKTLLEKGSGPNERTPLGTTALMLAAAHDHYAVVRLLIAHSADVNAKANDGTTALMSAAANGSIQTIKLLLANGARADLQDNSGRTAATLAEDRNHEAAARLLQPH